MKPLLLLLSFVMAASAAGQTLYTGAMPSGRGFGGVSAVGDGELFVGSAPVGWPEGEELPGSVYRYTKDAAGQWVEAGEFRAPDGRIGDVFGRSVLVQGSTLVIGAPGLGAAYVYEKDAAGTWNAAGVIKPSTLAENALFAGANERAANRTSALAMANGRLYITSFDAEAFSGAVHVFTKTNGAWVEETILTPAEVLPGDAFGYALAAEGDRLVVGAWRAGDGRGDVYVYTAGSWEYGKIAAAQEKGAFGYDVALHGEHVLVGAPGEAGGAVRVFEGDGAAWTEAALLKAPATEQAEGLGSQGGFGGRVVVSGDALVVGSRGGGPVHVMSAGDWQPAGVLAAVDERSGEGFGLGVGFSGDVAVVGSPRADYEEGVATVFEKESAGWRPASMLATTLARMESITDGQIDCKDGGASLFSCDKVDLLSMLSVKDISTDRGVKLNDVWGWTDPETEKEYVIQGRTDGTAFVDISNPHRPVYIGELLRTEGSPGSTWRDIKVYKDHAYIVADGAGAHGVQIFDLRQLRDVPPADMPVQFEMTAHYTGVHSTHNIAINEETGFAYAVGNRAGGETCGGQLHMINIQDPTKPTFAGCFTQPEAGGTHDSQCVVYRGPDTKFSGREVCFNSNGSSFIIADVTDKQNPVTLAQVDYPDLAYTHQGWLTEDHRHFYMNDELDEMYGYVDSTRTLIWDVKELEDPLLVREFSLASRASDHNLYIRGNLLYESNYLGGLRILDITDPLNPVETAHFDTVPYGPDMPGFGGSWSNYPYFKSGVIAVSSGAEGLFLVKKQDADI
ncbi:MAG: choice-of-anchor B family protein [Rhodothermales bacterium]|nr:choice-of-anchor B family protein [Rhodothermales bacterium]